MDSSRWPLPQLHPLQRHLENMKYFWRQILLKTFKEPTMYWRSHATAGQTYPLAHSSLSLSNPLVVSVRGVQLDTSAAELHTPLGNSSKTLQEHYSHSARAPSVEQTYTSISCYSFGNAYKRTGNLKNNIHTTHLGNSEVPVIRCENGTSLKINVIWKWSWQNGPLKGWATLSCTRQIKRQKINDEDETQILIH